MPHPRQVLTFSPVASMLGQYVFLAPMKGGCFMIARSSSQWNLLLVGMLGVLLVTPHAFGQQPADQPSTQPAAPPAPSQPPTPPAAAPMPPMQQQPTSVPGRPDIPNAEVATQLRGVPPPPFPTPEDKLPIPQLKLPKGFKIEVYASGIANARIFPSSKRSRTTSTTRQSPSSSTAIFSTISRMAGNSWAWGRTTSSTSTSARRAISASHPRRTRRSGA